MRIVDRTRGAGGTPDTARTVVVTPTVAARGTTREQTLRQWRALGHDPIVVRQDSAVPYGHRAQRDTLPAPRFARICAPAPRRSCTPRTTSTSTRAPGM